MQCSFDAVVAGEKTKHVGVRLHPDMHKRIKMLCVLNEITVQDFIEGAAIDRVHELERRMQEVE